MHVQTHILSGWCAANLLRLTPRQRLAGMIAASAADLDGMGILFGQEAYWRYHHTRGHNLLFGLILSTGLTLITGGKLRVLVICLALFHLHLLMDFFGSGPGWPMVYLWPFSRHQWNDARWSWSFYSWQNLSTAGLLVVWTPLIARQKGRTPLEAVMPKLDRQLVQVLSGTHAPKRRSSANQGAPDA